VAWRVHEAYATPPATFAVLSGAEVATLCDLLRKLDPGTRQSELTVPAILEIVDDLRSMEGFGH
jgi:hypothetical protein